METTTMRRKFRRGLTAVAAVLTIGVLGLPQPASAHGEEAQEPFLKTRTIGWVDVDFQGGEVREGESGELELFIKQGDPVTITGTATIMDQWPNTLADGRPQTGFLTVIAPGPVVTIQEKSINGVSAPHRIQSAKGDVYPFEMVIEGRATGRWHVHAAFAVKGAGTLLGPGRWINIEKADEYSNPLTLANGKVVNLENYRLQYVWLYSTVTFLIGVAWMLYWTLRKRTVQNLAVTSQIPLNTDGMNVGLITKEDHRNMNIFLVVTLVLTVGGFLWQANQYPDKLPQQVIEFAPPQPELASFASGLAKSSTFDHNTDTLTVTVELTNNGDTDMEIAEYTASTLAFVNPDLRDPLFGQAELKIEPAGPIPAGETKEVTLTMTDKRWTQDQLVPAATSQLATAGLIVLESGDEEQFVEVNAPLKMQHS